MDSNILNTLQNIRQQTSLLNRVAFVFHCWLPFNNLNGDGFRIPAIQSAHIPRLELIPIVSIRVPLIDSVRDGSTNKFVPVVQQHARPIEASYSIITQRYGKYGFIMARELECELDRAEDYIRYFNQIMRPFIAQGGKMQDLCEYFGAESPVKDILDKRTVRVTTTASKELDNMYRAGVIEESDYHKFLAAMKTFAQSAILAHRQALLPGYGILQESITAVNDKDKARFDAVDEFLIREFPDFDSSSRITLRAQVDSTSALVDVMKEFLNRMPVGEAAKVVQAVAPGIDVPADIELPTEEQPVVIKCMATTKSGSPCQLDARPGFKSCVNIAHQKALGEFAEEIANAQTS